MKWLLWIVNVRFEKAGLPKIAATIGVMMSATNAVATAANARPKTRPTATSTRFPRNRNSLKSFTTCPFRLIGVESSLVSLTVLNPATEDVIAELEPAGGEEADAAVARAKAAFPAWRAVAPADRARLLRRLATLVEEHHEELSRIESRNVGKPIAGARGEVGMVAQVFHFYAGAVDKHYGETV